MALLAATSFTKLVWIETDVLDVEEDRKHPTKRHRPVASGLVPPRAATIYAALLAVAGLALGYLVGNFLKGEFGLPKFRAS